MGKWTNEISSNFTESVHMTDGSMVNLITVREMHIEITMHYHFILSC